MTTINLDGFPDDLARLIEATVRKMREQLHRRADGRASPPPIPTRPGHVIGSLTREELYRDATRLRPI